MLPAERTQQPSSRSLSGNDEPCATSIRKGSAHGTLTTFAPLSVTNLFSASQISMPEVTFHALRHTHASQLIDAGVDIVTISKRLGHAKPDITLRTYAHLFRKDDGKAAAINAAFKPVVG
jgi:integrase